MPKSEERRSHIVPSSSSSPRFFSWKSRSNSTKRSQQPQPPPPLSQQQQQQPKPIPSSNVSISSPSSPLMMEKDQRSSCSSPQLVRLTTPKPIHPDDHRSFTRVKMDVRKFDENSNQAEFDEHIQIALYAQQLASISEKTKQNPTGIPPPIRFPSCPMNLQMNNQYHPRTMGTASSTMLPVSSIRSLQMDHESAEKRLIISKLEAKNR